MEKNDIWFIDVENTNHEIMLQEHLLRQNTVSPVMADRMKCIIN